MMMIRFFPDSSMGLLVKNEKSLYCFLSRAEVDADGESESERDDDGETTFTASNIKP